MDSPTILLVEDNADDVQLAREAFSGHELRPELVVAADGEEALDYLFATGEYAARPPEALPSVVLLDLKLPRLGGIEVLRRVRQDPRTKLLPVVVLTTSVEERDLVDSYAAGANSYVRKPVDFEEFEDAAQQLAWYWLVLNQRPAPGARHRWERG